MSFIYERVLDEEFKKKAEYFGISEFIKIQTNSDVSVAKKWCPQSYFFPSKYREICQDILNFKVRPDDVWVVTFPKCGTTWTQEMVWQICNDLDFGKGKSINLNTRFPFLELEGIASSELKFDTVEFTKNLASPRLIKSHLPAPLLPKEIWTVKPKIVYVARNVKDAAISYFHHYRSLQGYKFSFTDFLDVFLNDAVIYAPYHTHIVDFWNMRNEENILFITYEEMKKNHPEVIRRVAEFLEKPLTDEQITNLADHLKFDNMTKNASVNFEEELNYIQKVIKKKKENDYNFIRKGKVGSYHDEMTPELIAKFDTWIEERMVQYQMDPHLREIFITNKESGFKSSEK
ncbi:luciferin sulfotransferase-like [Lutzomyia longipalpis]|uniref:luciferin sulfotransferase-like n=1 Tax=Lutzomyia longipalpis TaxID=7200 RepID=UPI0024833533|nr:luciferin sulfotransferase-like [Lutzomyia longipalpis]